MKVIRLMMLLTVFAAASSSLPVLAYTQTSPVIVSACIVNGPLDTLMRPGISLTNGVTVILKNVSPKVVKSITVTGNYHGRVVTDSADVTLAPGQSVQINRKYNPSVFYDTDAKCSITHVVFADGTAWKP